MSEFERTRSAVPPFVTSPPPDAFVSDEDLEAPPFADPAFVREGLPAGFRMRHDAHYVDQLTSRTTGPQVRLIPIGDIDVAKPGDARDLAPLVKSIQQFGVLQPLLVRPRAGRFELIAGARRLAAAAAAALTEVPCMVHQVDDLKARALAEAENVDDRVELHAPAVPPVIAPVAAAPRPSPPLTGLQELGQSFGAIGSCLHLLAERDTALRDRVALDLVRTEVHRASRLVEGLRLLAQDPALSETGVSLVSAFDQVAEGFVPERRLSGVSLTIEPADGAHRVHADPEWLAVGLSGALGGMLAFVQTARNASLTVTISSSGSSVVLQIEQSGVTVPAWAIGRFFDTEWTDRPGGFQAAIELAAARRVAELHHGGLELVAGERSGCKLVLLLPAE